MGISSSDETDEAAPWLSRLGHDHEEMDEAAPWLSRLGHDPEDTDAESLSFLNEITVPASSLETAHGNKVTASESTDTMSSESTSLAVAVDKVTETASSGTQGAESAVPLSPSESDDPGEEVLSDASEGGSKEIEQQ